MIRIIICFLIVDPNNKDLFVAARLSADDYFILVQNVPKPSSHLCAAAVALFRNCLLARARLVEDCRDLSNLSAIFQGIRIVCFIPSFRPCSFYKTSLFKKDSNSDGTGDLKGVTSKLDHLVDIGVSAVWLSPIYRSPGVDHGYDISDYREIDPLFGDLNDFRELLVEAHARGIRVVLDLVPNHTSDEHEWFVKSANRTVGYEEYYVW